MFLLNKVTTVIWIVPVALSVILKAGNNRSYWGQANENISEHITEFSKDVPRTPFYEAKRVMKDMLTFVRNLFHLKESNGWYRYWPFRKTSLRVPHSQALRAPHPFFLAFCHTHICSFPLSRTGDSIVDCIVDWKSEYPLMTNETSVNTDILQHSDRFSLSFCIQSVCLFPPNDCAPPPPRQDEVTP